MIDLSINDIIDVVFNRYVESYRCTLDLLDFMPEKDIDVFFAYLRSNMLKDFKRVKKEARILRRLKKKEARKAKKKGKCLNAHCMPNPEAVALSQPPLDKVPAVVEEKTDE